MWRKVAFVGVFLTLSVLPRQTSAQPADTAKIGWEVANRFRLFATQAEFDRHLKAFRDSGGKSMLATEQTLALDSGGKGWGNTVGALCFDDFRGRIRDRCKRDGVIENYLNPVDERVRLSVRLPDGFAGATCDWQIVTGDETKTQSGNCSQAIENARVGRAKPSTVSVTAKTADGRTTQASTTIQVRDILVVAMGDSIASGEGNPMKPVALSDEGFCFQRALSGQSHNFFLPGRADVHVVADCPASPADIPDDRPAWDAAAAGWLFSPCHRSLYGYQMRAALALALENPQISVTLLPLGCTGATIAEGLLASQESRERPRRGRLQTGPVVEGQISQLRNYLLVTSQRGPFRPIDLMLLTIGANDIGFSGLVADVIIAQNPERNLAIKGGVLVTPDEARAEIKQTLADDFPTLRRALLPLTGGRLDHVVFTTYGNPATFDAGKPCGTSRIGFDSHPAFAVDGNRLAASVKFVNDEFLPALKAFVTCGQGGGCANADTQSMVYVDSHSEAFGSHGFCAQSGDDPAFDKSCFRDGDSFKSAGQDGLAAPLTCPTPATQFQPYVKRARWVRTANDSYFAAMTYPTREGLLSSPANIHDAIWGVESVVYGGALHPTAEGHAAMADATLVAARKVLGLAAP